MKSIPKAEAYLIEEYKQADLGIILILPFYFSSFFLLLFLVYSFLFFSSFFFFFFLKRKDMFQVNVRTESVTLKDLGVPLRSEV